MSSRGEYSANNVAEKWEKRNAGIIMPDVIVIPDIILDSGDKPRADLVVQEIVLPHVLLQNTPPCCRRESCDEPSAMFTPRASRQ